MPDWLIGADSGCDVVVDHQVVSSRHCRLSEQPDGLFLTDLDSTNGTFVNGQRLTTRRHVSPADVITLGNEVSFPWPKDLARRVVSIGQATDNDVVVDQPTISGHHARLTVGGAALLLEDLGSTNGTFVGSLENRIQTAEVMPTDRIFFGSKSVELGKLLSRVDWSPQAAAGGPSADRHQVSPTAPSEPAEVAALQTPRSAASASHAERSPLQEYLLPGLAGMALVVILVVGLLMVVTQMSDSAASNGEAAPAGNTTAGQESVRTVASPASGSGFKMGRFREHDAVEEIRVEITMGSAGQALREPLDLDLGSGFVLRLWPETSASSGAAAAAVALPQESSLATGMAEVAAGESAWFRFSRSDDASQSAAGRRTRQILADFWFSDIRTLEFAAEGKSNWMLAGYRIDMNGQLLASHDSVNWWVKKSSAGEQQQLDKLLSQQQALEAERQEIAGYLETGLADDSYRRNLAEKEVALKRLAKEIAEQRRRTGSRVKRYVERSPALRLASAPADGLSGMESNRLEHAEPGQVAHAHP